MLSTINRKRAVIVFGIFLILFLIYISLIYKYRRDGIPYGNYKVSKINHLAVFVSSRDIEKGRLSTQTIEIHESSFSVKAKNIYSDKGEDSDIFEFQNISYVKTKIDDDIIKELNLRLGISPTHKQKNFNLYHLYDNLGIRVKYDLLILDNRAFIIDYRTIPEHVDVNEIYAIYEIEKIVTTSQ